MKKDSRLFPDEAKVTTITNMLASAFQNLSKTRSCPISLDSESYELETCFLKAELGDQRLYRNRHLQNELFASGPSFSMLFTC